MDDKYISLIAKYLAGDIGEQEREALFALVNSSEAHKVYFEEMQSVWDLSSEEEEESVDIDAAWQKVAPRIKPEIERLESNTKGAKFFQIGQLLKIAAVFIGVIAAFLLFKNFNSTAALVAYETTTEEKKEIILPDGSMVWLNEHSKLSYSEDFEPRVVNLEGEAFFDVKHLDKKHTFEILSGEAKTTVLGTSFNVRAYPNETEIEVTVQTGKVKLEKKSEKTSNSKIFLTPGQSGVYNKVEKDVNVSEETISNANAWKTEKLDFENAKLSEVVEVMERYYGVEIKVVNPKILDCPFTGKYKNPKIDQLIKVLKFSLPIDINENNKTLTFTGEGCD